MPESTELVYAGFGRCLLASLINALFSLALVWLLSFLAFLAVGGRPLSTGADFGINVIMALVVLLFWVTRQVTPGKLMLGLRIIDAGHGGRAPFGRLVLRYFGYLLSALPLGLGYLWMLWDPRQRCWHDKLGGTLVVRLG